jgi:RNA 2',3'-cyclic 3'-phosphodiesterase
MSAIRTFLAVEIGPHARRAASEAARRLAREVRGREVRWAKPDTYHVTLRFLGEIPEQQVAPLAARVAETVADLAPFELRLGALTAFPSARRPRVLAVTIEPEAPLAALARRVEAAVIHAGFPGEERGFRPHLTLGRVRDRAHPDLGEAEPLVALPFRVAEVVLFASDLGAEGAVHTPLERIALGGPGPVSIHTSGGEAVHGQERPTL